MSNIDAVAALRLTSRSYIMSALEPNPITHVDIAAAQRAACEVLGLTQ
jgi:hypothetical protein